MYLNAEQLVDPNSPIVMDPLGLGKKAQIGYDLTVCEIKEIKGGTIYKNSKRIEDYTPISFIKKDNLWVLHPGIYSLTFDQFVKLPANLNAEVKHRSTLLRIGAQIETGVFDPGFESQIGATMIVHNNIYIEKHSRIAQIIVCTNQDVKQENLYGGSSSSYQKDKDIK